MQQLKGGKGSSAMSQWAHNQSILRDQAVDDAMAKAKTDMLYAKYLEREQFGFYFHFYHDTFISNLRKYNMN